jgi:hypothetical protein
MNQDNQRLIQIINLLTDQLKISTQYLNQCDAATFDAAFIIPTVLVDNKNLIEKVQNELSKQDQS